MTKISIEVGYQDTKRTDDLARYTRWTPAAVGHKYWTFEVEVDEVLPIEEVAEAVFVADNAPFTSGLAGKIRDAMIEAYRKTPERHHSLSVGDRVRVGEVEVVVADAGFQRVRRPAA